MEIEQLSKRYRPVLSNPKLQEAFDALIKVWSRENPAMTVSNLFFQFDVINLLTNLHTRVERERLKSKLGKLKD